MSLRTMFSTMHVILLAVAVGFVGCGKKEEPKPAPAPAVQQPAPPPAPAVTAVTLAKGIDITWAAVNPRSEFKPSDRINTSVKTENAVAGNKLLVKWMYLGTNQLVKADSVVLRENGVNNSAFYIERAKGFPPGDYRLDVYLNGAMAKSAGFKVVK